MERRSLLQMISIGALAPAWAAAADAEPYRPRFFTPEEIQLLDQLTELIIPADDHSPGAHAAKVSLFADWMVSNGDDDVRRAWREGLADMREQAAKTTLADALATAAAAESPFFARLKNMTIDGYYTSEIGVLRDLEYKGNQYVAKFPACDE